jgi:3-oxoacyl-[acyl-carrier-protein] synthase-1
VSSTAVYLNELGVVCALGNGRAQVRDGLFADQPGGLRDNDSMFPGRTLALGEVGGALPDLSALPVALRGRNNALLESALQQIRPAVDAAIARYGAERVAVIIGTSTSGIGESEDALRLQAAEGRWPDDFHYASRKWAPPRASCAARQQRPGLFDFHRLLVERQGAGQRRAAAARRHRRRRGCRRRRRAVRFTVAGFSALESCQRRALQSFLACTATASTSAKARRLFLMTREPGPVRLAGWGEAATPTTCRRPSPGGRGAMDAMRQALAAPAWPADIDYVNLHGTATPHNDAMESLAVAPCWARRCRSAPPSRSPATPWARRRVEAACAG